MQLAGNSHVDASLRQNLRTLNAFIASANASEQNPQDELAREYLYTAYQQKPSLLAAMMESGRGITKMQRTIKHRQSLSVWSFGLLSSSLPAPLPLLPEHQERHFAVKGHPVVVLRTSATGASRVKSSKNPEVIVSSTPSPTKWRLTSSRSAIAFTSRLFSQFFSAAHEVEAIFSSPCLNRPNSSSKLRPG